MGYIKISRSILEWGWFDDPNTLALWIHLILEANWKDGEWHGETVKRGQMITSISKLSVSSGLSNKQVRICLERLVKGGEIIKEGASQWTKITICKYDTYQGDDEEEGQTNGERRANEGQADGKQTATIEEGKKEIKEEIKKQTSNEEKRKVVRFVKPSVDDVRSYCRDHGYNIDPEAFVNFYESKGWVVGKSPMKDWKAAVRTWVSKRYSSQQNSIFQQDPPPATPEKPSFQEAMERAKNPTKEEVAKFWNERVAPHYPKKDGETEEEYRERMRPIYKVQYESWIEDRIFRTQQKYL